MFWSTEHVVYVVCCAEEERTIPKKSHRRFESEVGVSALEEAFLRVVDEGGEVSTDHGAPAGAPLPAVVLANDAADLALLLTPVVMVLPFVACGARVRSCENNAQ